MRREARAAPARRPPRDDLLEAALGVGAGALGLRRVRVVDQRRRGHRAHARRPRPPARSRARASTCPRSGRRAGADHLDAGEPRAPVDVVVLHPLLDRPDVLGQPLHQRQVVGEAAKQGHRRVGVAVDEAGDQRHPGAVDDLVAGLAARPRGRRRRSRRRRSAARPRLRRASRWSPPVPPLSAYAESSRVGEDGVRDDLAEVLERRRLTGDEARARGGRAPPRRAAGAPRARTSPTSSTPAASSSTAASRSPPSGCAGTPSELIARTPADGLIAGTARINGELHGERRGLRGALLRLHRARRHPGRDRPPQEGPPVRADRAHAPADRAVRRGRRRAARRHRLRRRLGARHPRVRALGAALGRRAADRGRRRALLRRQRGARRRLRPDRRHARTSPSAWAARR